MSSLSLSSFSFEDIPTTEVDAAEALYGGLADDLRDLVDVTIRTRVDDDRVARARALVPRGRRRARRRTRRRGPAGIHYNAEGRSWNWGNAVVGVRNAVAPPVRLEWVDDETVRLALSLGRGVRGPAGERPRRASRRCSSTTSWARPRALAHTRVTVTGTLTLRYEQPLPLGPVRMEARIAEVDGRKVTVTAWIAGGRAGRI